MNSPHSEMQATSRAPVAGSGFSGAVSKLLEKLLFEPVQIVNAERWTDRFCAIRMEGSAFSNMRWKPGQTIQLFLGNLTKRAYTPVDVCSDTSSALFLCYLHGNGPGSRWAETVQAGDVCHVMRPNESIDFERCGRPSVFFGDETSLSSAHALLRYQAGNEAPCLVLEADSTSALRSVLERLSISGGHLVERTPDGLHLRQAVSKLIHASEAKAAIDWVFTGNARSIQTVRKELQRGGAAVKKAHVRAYWSPGKTGLD